MNNQTTTLERSVICDRTQTRTEACMCGRCGRGSPDAKLAANKRDVLALLGLIAGCVDCHPKLVADKPTWSLAGDVAHLREQLVAIATGIALTPDGSEQAARRGIESALGTDDEDVAEALINAMCTPIAKPTEDTMSTETTQPDHTEIADELDQIRDEIIKQCERARTMLRRAAPRLTYERARMYWLAHILAAAGAEEYRNPYDTTICNTIEELRDGEDGDEG